MNAKRQRCVGRSDGTNSATPRGVTIPLANAQYIDLSKAKACDPEVGSPSILENYTFHEISKTYMEI